MKKKSDFNLRSIAVVGAGPVGSVVAAFLARGGFEVTLCDINPQLIEHASSRGIIIEGAENIKQSVINVCTGVDEIVDYNPDVIFITAKANATPLIASAIEGFIHKGMYVVSWQNGIDTELDIAHSLGRKQVLRAVMNFGCRLKGPSDVILDFHHPPHYIQELDPESSSAAIAIAMALSDSGLATEKTDNIISMVWKKAILNACTNPVCAITGLTMSKAMIDPFVFQLVDSLFKECIEIARANEVALGWDYYSYGLEHMKKAGDHKPPMLIDIENNRRTEIDFLNGKFIEYGRQAGIDTPYNKTLLSLIKAIEP